MCGLTAWFSPQGWPCEALRQPPACPAIAPRIMKGSRRGRAKAKTPANPGPARIPSQFYTDPSPFYAAKLPSRASPRGRKHRVSGDPQTFGGEMKSVLREAMRDFSRNWSGPARTSKVSSRRLKNGCARISPDGFSGDLARSDRRDPGTFRQKNGAPRTGAFRRAPVLARALAHPQLRRMVLALRRGSALMRTVSPLTCHAWRTHSRAGFHG